MEPEEITEFDPFYEDEALYYKAIVSLISGEILGYEIAADNFNKDSCGKNIIINLLSKLPAESSNVKFFIKISSDILKDDSFLKALIAYFKDKALKSKNIIFEIEHSLTDVDEKIINNIDKLKAEDINLSILNPSNVNCNIELINIVNPKYIRIKNDFINKLRKNKPNQNLINAIIDFCNKLNICIIADAIDSKEELLNLIELGIDYGEGDYLSKSSWEMASVPVKVKELIIEKSSSRFQPKGASCTLPVGQIAEKSETIHEETLCYKVEAIFKKDNYLQGIPIVNEANTPVGIIMRSDFFARIGTQYGWSLYMNRPVNKIMDTNALIVDVNFGIDEVSKLITERNKNSQYDLIIIKKSNKYFGVITVMSIFEKMMEIQLNEARYSNPLTGLPGNMVIDSKISELIYQKETFYLIYLDLNDFKAYNDIYGFDSGDKIICFLANIVQRQLYFYRHGFLGHIGGDDFVVIIKHGDAENLCKNITHEFDFNVKRFYNEKDSKRGYIKSFNRDGKEAVFPIMSVAVAAIKIKYDKEISLNVIGKKSAAAKKHCKELCKHVKKSCYTIE